MALSGYTIWEVEAGSGSDTAGGGFDPSQTAGMNTDGAATSATGASPVFTSASYNFGSGDVGARLFIASGTNWIPGWYKIASVAANAATLNGTAGQGVLYGNSTTNGLTTTTGCATTASPTSATWSIDYSQQASAQVAFTDLVIGATTTNLTSVANPFGKQWVGNLLNVTSGTNFTTGWYVIKSVATVTATMDRSVGTAASSSGNGKMGGAWATLTNTAGGSPIVAAGNIVWFTGTLTITSTYTYQQSYNNLRLSIRGYGTYRGDGTQAKIQTSTNSVNGITIDGAGSYEFMWINLVSTAGTPGYGIYGHSANSTYLTMQNCNITGWEYGISGGSFDYSLYQVILIECEISSCTSHGALFGYGNIILLGCYFLSNGGNGYYMDGGGNPQTFIAYGCVFASNTGSGFNLLTLESQSPGPTFIDCVFYNNTVDGATINSNTTNAAAVTFLNCIFYGNTGYGANISQLGAGASPGSAVLQRNNAFGSNTSGPRGGSNNPVGIAEVTLTANPFVSASTGNFTLNSTSGGGALCQLAGWQSQIVN